MIKQLEEDALPMAKKAASSAVEFDFNLKDEEENPFHYVQNKGQSERRRSSFAGTGFEKLASTD